MTTHNLFVEGDAWCIWVRECYQPDGVWFPLTHMIRRTRRESIQAWKDSMEVPAWRGQNWEAHRRRDVVKAARILVTPALPNLDFRTELE